MADLVATLVQDRAPPEADRLEERQHASALGIGEGSELMQPLAIAVVSGMFLSMALTLFVVPGAYVGMNRFAERLKGWALGRREAEEEEGEPRPPRPAREPVPSTVQARGGGSG